MRTLPDRNHSLQLAALIAFSFALATSALHGSLPANPFLGYWTIDEPAGDTCYIVVKTDGDASIFWSGTVNHIEEGTWEHRGDTLVVSWNTGYRDVLKRNDDGTMTRETYLPGRELHESPSLAARGRRLEREIVGNLTTAPPERAREGRPQQDAAPRHAAPAPAYLRNAFIGYWEVEQDGADFMGLRGVRDRYYLQVARDGTVTATQRHWGREHRNQTGRWRIEGNELRVRWPSGHADALRRNSDGTYSILSWTPRQDETGRPDRTAAARTVPATQLRGLFQAGQTTHVSVEDFIGYWTDDSLPPGAHRPHLKIERWGNAYRYIDAEKPGLGRIRGEWEMKSDGVVITWHDGGREVIDLTSAGTFVQSSFAAGAPLAGTPRERRTVRRITRQEQATVNAQAMARERAEAESRRR